jgi:cellulose synthase/poly-beta-1,6-N-acetylglucosamine synthase-like glycosyltransferase
MKKSENIKKGREKFDISLTTAGIILTIIFAGLFLKNVYPVVLSQYASAYWGGFVRDCLFVGIVLYLIYGGMVYLVTRLGYLSRKLKHQTSSYEDLDSILDTEAPSLTVLIPSYKEESRVVMQTLMSAALQNYPEKRVVLLIDDSPFPTNVEDEKKLVEARSLPSKIHALLEEPSSKFGKALEDYRKRLASGCINIDGEADNLTELFADAAAWFDAQIGSYEIADHTDTLFVQKVLAGNRDMLIRRVRNLKGHLNNGRRPYAKNDLLRLYRVLAATFSVDVSYFERKLFVNLSHEPNKAMNLNSYIGISGKSFSIDERADGHYMEEQFDGNAQFHVPEADFFITLDADSILLPEYALRLIHIAEQPKNERMAIAQTPYSAVPDARSLERIAGATTDMQYIIHQGFTRYNGTYWVGANALLRKTALDDICVKETERGFETKKYIQDRTVIEDTESTIDLVSRGWRLFNYPERLSYSATPPDFGSLIIQRRRWANGGLIILPKFLKYFFRRPFPLYKLAEGFVRFHYLTSLAVVNFGVLMMMSMPVAENIFNLWLPLSALPYFALYARDLSLSGYRIRDVFRVYALNLMLIPVNLAGVIKSIQQGLTGKKIPFGRTPKVKGRVTTAMIYILFEYGLLALWISGMVIDFFSGRYIHGAFVVMNLAFLYFAIKDFIGFRESREDFIIGLRQWKEHFAFRRRTGAVHLETLPPTIQTQPATKFPSSLKIIITAESQRQS